MHIPLRRIGNSKGIILPAALIAACGFENEVDLKLEGKSLVIEAAGKPRLTWFDSWVAEGDIDAWKSLPTAEGTEEWEW